MSDAIETSPLLERAAERSATQGERKATSSLGDTSKTTHKTPYVQWRARDNRKGRHVLILPSDYKTNESPTLSSSWSSLGKGLWRMCTVWAWWDVSWWIAVHFSFGCLLFIVAGFFHWLPDVAPTTKFASESQIAGYLIFIGATMFAFAGFLLVVEATNENQTGCFGWAIASSLSSDGPADLTHSGIEGFRVQHLVPGECQHIHSNSHAHTLQLLHGQHPDTQRTWEWWPAWHELKSHYFRDIGSLASFILALGTIVFWVSGIMALPPISRRASQPIMLGTYWLSFLVGGILFVTSSVMYMLEAQRSWYTPNIRSIGWWAGFWNFIGSFGWVLSASFGYCTPTWCEFQSHLTLLWASFAFFFGSLLLWYEALEKYPVERETREAGKHKSDVESQGEVVTQRNNIK